MSIGERIWGLLGSASGRGNKPANFEVRKPSTPEKTEEGVIPEAFIGPEFDLEREAVGMSALEKQSNRIGSKVGFWPMDLYGVREENVAKKEEIFKNVLVLGERVLRDLGVDSFTQEEVENAFFELWESCRSLGNASIIDANLTSQISVAKETQSILSLMQDWVKKNKPGEYKLAVRSIIEQNIKQSQYTIECGDLEHFLNFEAISISLNQEEENLVGEKIARQCKKLLWQAQEKYKKVLPEFLNAKNKLLEIGGQYWKNNTELYSRAEACLEMAIIHQNLVDFTDPLDEFLRLEDQIILAKDEYRSASDGLDLQEAQNPQKNTGQNRILKFLVHERSSKIYLQFEEQMRTLNNKYTEVINGQEDFFRNKMHECQVMLEEATLEIDPVKALVLAEQSNLQLYELEKNLYKNIRHFRAELFSEGNDFIRFIQNNIKTFKEAIEIGNFEQTSEKQKNLLYWHKMQMVDESVLESMDGMLQKEIGAGSPDWWEHMPVVLNENGHEDNSSTWNLRKEKVYEKGDIVLDMLFMTPGTMFYGYKTDGKSITITLGELAGERNEYCFVEIKEEGKEPSFGNLGVSEIRSIAKGEKNFIGFDGFVATSNEKETLRRVKAAEQYFKQITELKKQLLVLGERAKESLLKHWRVLREALVKELFRESKIAPDVWTEKFLEFDNKAYESFDEGAIDPETAEFFKAIYGDKYLEIQGQPETSLGIAIEPEFLQPQEPEAAAAAPGLENKEFIMTEEQLKQYEQTPEVAEYKKMLYTEFKASMENPHKPVVEEEALKAFNAWWEAGGNYIEISEMVKAGIFD